MLDWQKVGSFYYRTRDVYQFPTHLGRSEVVDAKSIFAKPNSIVAICPCGGPVACLDPVSSDRKRLVVFTPSFRLIAEETLVLRSSVVGVWWTIDCEPVLNILTSDGLLMTITIRPGARLEVEESKLKPSKPIIGVAVGYKQTTVVSVVCLLESNTFFQLSNRQLSPFFSAEKLGPISCFSVVDSSRMLVAGEFGSLVLLDRQSGQSTILIEGSNEPSLQIQILSTSLSGNFVASYTASGAVSVYAVSDLDGAVLKAVDSSLLDIGLQPSQLAWVGDDCLCLSYSDAQCSRNVLFLGGIGGSWSPYEHESRIFVSSDLLCASVLTGSRFQVIQRVAQPTLNIASKNSAPESLLLAGFEKHVAGDLRSEGIVRSVKDQLEKAVNALAEAAAFETPLLAEDKSRIEVFLKASIFGRQFAQRSTVLGSSLFVNAAALIRLCSAVNDPVVGIPISVPQLMALGPRESQGGCYLVHMLASRGLFLLAQRVGKWLSVPITVVINRWACALIESSDNVPDRDLCELIVQRVPRHHSLCSIARFADKNVGRKNLAALLLQREPQVGQQVRMLLDLDSDELAIQKALAAEDIDLVHVCFDALIASQKSLHELITAKSSNLATSQVGLMLSLVQSRYYGERKFEELCKLLQTIPGSELLLADAALELGFSKFNSLGPSPSLAKSEDGSEWIQYSAERFAECVSAPSVVSGNSGKGPQGCQSTASLLAESSQLLKAQVQLEKTAAAKGWPRGPHKFVGLSLEATLKKLLLLGETAEAESLRNKRKMSDGKWWEFRVRLLLTGGRLEEGIGFANTVPVPISDCRGFKVVVETLLSLKREDLALPFIKKLKQKKQIEIYNQLGLFEEARAAEQQRTISVPGSGLLGRLASGFIGNR